jgi:FdhE protein
MRQVGSPRHDPIPIGEAATPSFARPPEPGTLFARRAERLRTLSNDHPLAPYLIFLASLSTVQHRIQDGLPAVQPPAADALARARAFAMPPLDRSRFVMDAVCAATVDRLGAAVDGGAIPQAAQAALGNLRAADPATVSRMVSAVLTDAIPVEAIAEHLFVAAALQVHFVRLATQLSAASLVPVGDALCPACGGPPVSSMVVGWPGAHGTRFCACALCGTLWNYVRIRCTACGSTKGIAYQEIEGGPDTIKAETCSACRSYVKVLHQHKDAELDPVADDLASLGLDLLMRETGFRRAGVNPFLLGY